MSKISDYAWQVATGAVRAPNIGYARCLSNAQQIASRALGYSVYSKYGSGWDFSVGSPTAATAESVWISKGLAVTSMQPGDLLFQQGDSPSGHVGVFLGYRDGVAYVLENTYANRGQVVGGQQYIRLTALNRFGPVRTIIRFPDDVKTQDDKNSSTSGGKITTAPPAGPPTPGVSTGDAGTPVGGPLALVGITATNDGTLAFNMPEGPDFRDDPDWLFQTLNPYKDSAPSASETNFGEVRGIVILRSPYAVEMENALPFFGPMVISGKNLLNEARKHWNTLYQQYMATEAWGKYYAPLYRLSTADAGNRNRYRYPIPDVTSISMRQEVGGQAVAEIECHITEAEHADMVLATLTMAAQFKNAFFEVWVPTSYYDPNSKDGQRTILYPAFVGVAEEVTASPWPHTIRFRVVPQDHYINARGVDPADGVPNSWPPGTTLAKIVGDIAKAYKIGVFTPSGLPTPSDLSGLSGLKQMQAQIEGEYNALYRPPMDVIREIVERTAGLRLNRLSGFELLGKTIGPYRSIWMVYDPLAYTPFTTGFWKNALWTNVTKKVFGLVTGNNNLVGEVAVFYPENLGSDLKAIKRLATTLDVYAPDEARATPLRRFLDTVSSIASAAGIGSGPAVKAAYEGETRTALISYLNDWYATTDSERTPTQKWLIPTLAVEDFTGRTPTEPELANPVFGTPFGQSGQRGVATTAEKAASLMQVAQGPDGGFFLQTQNGGQSFERKDKVYLYYAANMTRPSMVVPVNRQAEVDDAAGKFFPFTLTLRCKPTHGVRVGGVAVLVGFGRIDGHWEVHGVQQTLDGSQQELVVTLRTARNIYLV